MVAKEIQDYQARGTHLKGLFPSLRVSMCGSWVWIEGAEKSLASALKAQGCKWSSKKAKWYLKGRPSAGKKGMSWDYIVTKYGRDEVEEVRR